MDFIIKTIGQIIINELGELVYPTRCLGCDQRGSWFCKNCQSASQLKMIKTDCSLCRKLITIPGQLCQNCRRQTGLTGLSFYAKFSKPLRRAIHFIKYQNCWAALDYLTNLALVNWQLPHYESALVPIPLAKPKLRNRGYNQAEIIARLLQQRLNWPMSSCLVRHRNTQSQVGLSKIERQTNLIDCFSLVSLPPQSIILIDDVYTTGSTLKEAARTFRNAGVKKIWGLVLAKD
ncbi:ComF family protein [Candidatus Berkelbacteria bacterium]|nr:ComF family protein [Candidatus Berkelbacteria bacterium]